MKIKKISSYKDGGTIEIDTNDGYLEDTFIKVRDNKDNTSVGFISKAVLAITSSLCLFLSIF